MIAVYLLTIFLRQRISNSWAIYETIRGFSWEQWIPWLQQWMRLMGKHPGNKG